MGNMHCSREERPAWRVIAAGMRFSRLSSRRPRNHAEGSTAQHPRWAVKIHPDEGDRSESRGHQRLSELAKAMTTMAARHFLKRGKIWAAAWRRSPPVVGVQQWPFHQPARLPSQGGERYAEALQFPSRRPSR